MVRAVKWVIRLLPLIHGNISLDTDFNSSGSKMSSNTANDVHPNAAAYI